ncbi:MAG: cellulase family glycosylhydrolase [Acetobacteraceae bacterium]|nr:cellulase family glycosylhydrolase [Acetobacteraceae bacterium]
MAAVAAGLLLAHGGAWAEPPPARVAVLQRGVNVADWFGVPAPETASAIRAYIGDPAIMDLRRAGFTFVRLTVEPAFLVGAMEPIPLLLEAVRRLEGAGLGVVIELRSSSARSGTGDADRARLIAAWRLLAPALAGFSMRLTFPEAPGPPESTADGGDPEAARSEVLDVIRAALPRATVVLSSDAGGDLDGLLRLHPVADRNVVYSFRFFEPMTLVAPEQLGGDLDRHAMAEMPFPAAALCVPADAAGPTRAVIALYCAERWDAAKIAQRIARAAEWGRQNDAVVVATEFGANGALNPTARLAWLAAVRRACEEGRIGWAIWAYDDSYGLAFRHPPGARPPLNLLVLEALGLNAPR